MLCGIAYNDRGCDRQLSYLVASIQHTTYSGRGVWQVAKLLIQPATWLTAYAVQCCVLVVAKLNVQGQNWQCMLCSIAFNGEVLSR